MGSTDRRSARSDALRRFPASRYAVAIVATALAVALRLVLNPVLGDGRVLYTTLFATLLLVGWYAGLGPALVALALGAAATIFFILPPEFSWAVATPFNIAGLFVYLVFGAACALFGHTMQKARRQAEANAQLARDRQQQLEQEAVEQRRMENSLRESESQLRLIADHAPVMIAHCDDQSRYKFVNRPYAERFGLTTEDVIGKRIPEVVGEEAYAAFERYVAEALAGKAVTFEVEIPYQTGDVQFMRCAYTPERDENGRVVGLVAAIINISDRKQAEQALRESNERLKQVLEELQATYDQSPIGMLQLDTNLRYVRVNRTMAAMNGLPVAAHKGKSVYEVVPDLAANIESACRKVIETGNPVLYTEITGETRAEPGVRRTWIESWFPLRDPSGTLIGLNVVAQDITELKLAEEAMMRLNETLEERVAERTAALAKSEEQLRRVASVLTMAEQEERRRISQVLHDDLQQQLYAIQLKLDSARRDAEAGNVAMGLAGVAEAEQWIREGIETTRRLTVDLSPPILKSEGLVHMLGWLVSQMKEMHGLDVTLVADRPVRVQDEDMRVFLFQIVRELLFNVVKHAGAENATITLHEAQGRLVIGVADDGRGFDVSQAARAADDGGFGLFSVRERLGLFGGRMEIESAPGEGARVTVRVPRRLEEPLEATGAATKRVRVPKRDALL